MRHMIVVTESTQKALDMVTHTVHVFNRLESLNAGQQRYVCVSFI